MEKSRFFLLFLHEDRRILFLRRIRIRIRIHMTSGSGSGRPKNMLIWWIRIRLWIRNTVEKSVAHPHQIIIRIRIRIQQKSRSESASGSASKWYVESGFASTSNNNQNLDPHPTKIWILDLHPDRLQSDMSNPHPHQIIIRIRIRIKVKSRIQTKVMRIYKTAMARSFIFHWNLLWFCIIIRPPPP